MARGRKPKEKAPAGSAPVNLTNLGNLAKRILAKKQTLDDARMEHAGVYEQVESQGFDRRALKDALKVLGWDATKRQAYLDNFNAYYDFLKTFLGKDEPPLFSEGATERLGEKPGNGEDDEDEKGETEALALGKKEGAAGHAITSNPFTDEDDRAQYDAGWIAAQGGKMLDEIKPSVATAQSVQNKRSPRSADFGEPQGSA